MNFRLVSGQQQCVPIIPSSADGEGGGCWIHQHEPHVHCEEHDWFHPRSEPCGHCADPEVPAAEVA